MKITIDTKEDSHEDIRKIVALLSTLVKERQESKNIFEDSCSSLGSDPSPEPSGGNAFANMFGNSDEKKNDDEYVELGTEKKDDEEDSEDSLQKRQKPEEPAEIMTY